MTKTAPLGNWCISSSESTRKTSPLAIPPLAQMPPDRKGGSPVSSGAVTCLGILHLFFFADGDMGLLWRIYSSP